MPKVVEPHSLQSLSAEELRKLTTRLMTQLRHQSALLDKLTHENALLKRMKFAAQSERFNPEQKSLLENEIEAVLAAVATEIDALQDAHAPAKLEEKKAPKRAALAANLPRREIRHEPESTLCQCDCQMKRVGEDMAEKLYYAPGVFMWSATSGASGPARSARRSPKAPSILTSSTRASSPPGCWRRCWWRPPAAVPPGSDLRPSRPGYPALYVGAMGRLLLRAVAATGRCHEE